MTRIYAIIVAALTALYAPMANAGVDVTHLGGEVWSLSIDDLPGNARACFIALEITVTGSLYIAVSADVDTLLLCDFKRVTSDNGLVQVDVTHALETMQDGEITVFVSKCEPSDQTITAITMATDKANAQAVRVVSVDIELSMETRVDEISEGEAEASQNIASPELFSVYPTPFNPTLIIRLGPSVGGSASIRVFDIRGHCIKHIDYSASSGRDTEIRWEGITDTGTQASSGIYFVQVDNGKDKQSKRAVLVR